MENRLLNKYGTYSSTDIGQEVACVTDEFEERLKNIINLHQLTITEQHTIQNIVISMVQCLIAENTLRNGLKIRQEERNNKQPSVTESLTQPPP